MFLTGNKGTRNGRKGAKGFEKRLQLRRRVEVRYVAVKCKDRETKDN